MTSGAGKQHFSSSPNLVNEFGSYGRCIGQYATPLSNMGQGVCEIRGNLLG